MRILKPFKDKSISVDDLGQHAFETKDEYMIRLDQIFKNEGSNGCVEHEESNLEQIIEKINIKRLKIAQIIAPVEIQVFSYKKL